MSVYSICKHIVYTLQKMKTLFDTRLWPSSGSEEHYVRTPSRPKGAKILGVLKDLRVPWYDGGGGGCPRPLGTCSQEHAHFFGTCIPDSDSGDGTCGETLAREPQNTVQNAERHGNIPKIFSPAAGCILLFMITY